MKTLVEMVSKIQPGWSALITVEKREDSSGQEFHEAIKKVYLDDFVPVVETKQCYNESEAHNQVWSWIGQMHFRDWEILQKRTED